MATPREIRRRIRSVRNTSQITRAMEMVSASKMRRAQQQVVATRPYADRIRAMIGDLASIAAAEDISAFPLLQRRPIQRVGMILITSDRGLAGAFNTNLLRHTFRFLSQEHGGRTENVEMVTVGRKGRDYFARLGHHLEAEFPALGDTPSFESIRPIVRIATDDFISGRVDAVFVSFTRFINTLNQVPEIRQVLPIEAPEGEGKIIDYIFEPSAGAVLEALLPRFVEVQIFQAVLESLASEHSARMVSMRNATDNARELVTELTLTYNKARQAQITREVSEIAAGAAALGG